MQTYDIIIVGGGIVGATAALALAQQTPLQIALLDVKPLACTWQADKKDYRVSAISLASQRIFQHLNVWQRIQTKRSSAYRAMHVWDAAGNGKIHFDCASLNVPELGYIIEDSVIRASVLEKFSDFANLHLIAPVTLTHLHTHEDYLELTTATQQTLRAKLVIGADGGNSWVREQAQIELKSWDYQHTAIVATVRTTLPHQQTAWQRFLTTGPLAFLPLADPHECSIVWSAAAETAQRLLALPNDLFQQELTTAFAQRLGAITQVSPRYHFNLHKRHARRYIKPRLALLGDAAHTIHPLAGQGVNMGLLDAACLVEVIEKAIGRRCDFASQTVLRRYERWRKSENTTMLAFVDGIKYLFANETKPLQNMRNLGLNITDKMPFVKDFFANYAMGNRAGMPLLANYI